MAINTGRQRMTLEEYAATTTGPLASVWSVNPSDVGYYVSFPNGGTAVVGTGITDWGHEFQKDLATSRLWFHSLTYAPYFYWDHNDWDTTAGVFQSYASYLRDAQAKPDYSPINSLDHAHAVQLLAACAVYASLVSRGELYSERRELLIEFVGTVARSALSEGMIKFNNHGMMLTRALAHVAFVFKDQTQIATECGAYGIHEFDRIISAAFDNEGIVNENTPAYQILYMRVIETMISFVDRSELGPSYVQKWEELMRRARVSLSIQLYADNGVPPIGDDAGGFSPYPSSLGELFSPTNGLFVSKTEETYVSIISGYRGVVHKHFDDTTIRLKHMNVDLILDAGLLNYDLNDKIGLAIVSQRGHSGLFFPKFDYMRPMDAFLAQPPRQTSSISRSSDSDGHDQIECHYVLDNEYRAERTYTFLDETSIFISDRFAAPDEEQAIQRFLFPRDAEIRHRYNSLEVRIDSVQLILWTELSNSVQFSCGSTGDQPKGWRAVKFYESEPCWTVEIASPPGRSTIKSAIAFGAAEQEIGLPVTARRLWS